MTYYIFKDDKGNEYEEADGHGTDEILTVNYHVDTKEIKSLTIIPRTEFNNDEPIMNYDKAIL